MIDEEIPFMKKSCINTNMLSKYLSGNMSESEKKGIESHFLECEMCRKDSVMATLVMNDNKLNSWERIPLTEAKKVLLDLNSSRSNSRPKKKTPEFIMSIKDWFGQFRLSFFLKPAYSYVRSHGTSKNTDTHIQKDIGNVRFDIQIEKSDDEASLNIKALDNHDHDLILTLKTESDIIGARKLSDDPIIFYDLDAGHYSLMLQKNGRETGCSTIQIHK